MRNATTTRAQKSGHANVHTERFFVQIEAETLPSASLCFEMAEVWHFYVFNRLQFIYISKTWQKYLIIYLLNLLIKVHENRLRIATCKREQKSEQMSVHNYLWVPKPSPECNEYLLFWKPHQNQFSQTWDSREEV